MNASRPADGDPRRALLVVDMQNGFLPSRRLLPQARHGPRSRRRPVAAAAETRHLHELSIEVPSSYQLAAIASITAGFDIGASHPIDVPART
jgi:hypothetical protein